MASRRAHFRNVPTGIPVASDASRNVTQLGGAASLARAMSWETPGRPRPDPRNASVSHLVFESIALRLDRRKYLIPPGGAGPVLDTGAEGRLVIRDT